MQVPARISKVYFEYCILKTLNTAKSRYGMLWAYNYILHNPGHKFSKNVNAFDLYPLILLYFIQMTKITRH